MVDAKLNDFLKAMAAEDATVVVGVYHGGKVYLSTGGDSLISTGLAWRLVSLTCPPPGSMLAPDKKDEASPGLT